MTFTALQGLHSTSKVIFFDHAALSNSYKWLQRVKELKKAKSLDICGEMKAVFGTQGRLCIAIEMQVKKSKSLAENLICAGIASRSLVLIFLISNSTSCKSSSILSQNIPKNLWYSSPSSRRNSCKSVLSIPISFLRVNQGLTHTDICCLFNFFAYRFSFFINSSSCNNNGSSSTFLMGVHDEMRGSFKNLFNLMYVC